MSRELDLLIVGSGAGGLSAAVAAASAGLSVLVLEAHDDVGGKLGRVLLDDGSGGKLEADTGPSVLTLPDVLASVTARAGKELADVFSLRRLDLATRYRWPSGLVLDTFGGPEDTLTEVERVFGSEAAGQLAGFFAYSRRIWEEAAPSFVLAPSPSPLALLGRALRSPSSALAVDPLRSLASVVKSRVQEPHLRDLLLRFATYNGSNALTCPATLACIVHVELGLGTYGVEGGMYALATGLEGLAKSKGAMFRCQARVSRIVVEGGRARGVLLADGEPLRARAVLANADARHVFGDLLGKDKTHQAPSMSAWTAVARARRRPERPPHEVLFGAPYEEEFRAIFERQQAPDEPTVYLCAQEKAHARRGWAEHEPVFLMANAPAGTPDDEALGTRACARLRAAGLLEPGDELVWQRAPSGLARAFPGTLGAIYGAASSTALAAFSRPKNRVRELPGLYLASGSVHPGGGVPLCLLSGLYAADAAAKDLGAKVRSVA
jgi:1-hydroxycarotenoid 3,4-desaturase